MPVFVKICGLRTAADVAAAAEAGADAVGFVLAESPRRVTAAEALSLGRELPPGVLRIAVFRRLDRAAVELAIAAGCDRIQATGSAADFAALPPGLVALPCVLDGPSAAAEVLALAALGVPVLLDGARPGTGTAADVARASAVARVVPIVLAGGLAPENVARAIAAVRPFGVDVSSGVELAPATKDGARVRAFVRAAREAARALEIA